ncbi:MAG: hypothetical protein WCW14_02870, partial [Candidatus Paceibacterota bacterium]
MTHRNPVLHKSNLRQKRRKSLLTHIILIIILCVVCIIGLLYVLNLQSLSIQDVRVEMSSSVPKQEIIDRVNLDIDSYFSLFVPKDSIFFFP